MTDNELMLIRKLLEPLAKIADAYEANELDESRPEWIELELEDPRDPSRVDLYCGDSYPVASPCDLCYATGSVRSLNARRRAGGRTCLGGAHSWGLETQRSRRTSEGAHGISQNGLSACSLPVAGASE